jgi:DNA helicase IV
VDAIAGEQAYVRACYDRLDGLIAHLESRIRDLSHQQSTGTEQDLLEKQAMYDSLAQQLTGASAARTRLCFGRIDYQDGAVYHIGRVGLRDDNGDPILLDWRAPQSAGFYQATTVEPMGLRRRRRIIAKGRTVTHVEDEDLTNPTAVASQAAADAVEAPRDGRMGDIIATIAADQDRIVRSPLNQLTVVQGGPGTGKTVVALHRAAWLLYTFRDRLAKDGVLVVGPSTTFLKYIDQVLPSLGETDVVLLTPGQLYPGLSTTAPDRPEVAAIKGDVVMAHVVANAVSARVRIPQEDVVVTLEDGSRVGITAAQLADARASLPRHGTFHSNREPFLRRVLDVMARGRAVERREDSSDPDIRQDIVNDLVDDAHLRRVLNLMWLPTTPEQLIGRLLSDGETMALAADGLLTRAQQRVLLREKGTPWTVDDVPLLDEAADRLGRFERPVRTAAISDQDEYRELVVEDPSARRTLTTTVAERAMSDRSWIYGHVVVDEAQELSRMAWRALARRCSRKSMTIVGDLNQTTHPAGARDWDEALGWARERIDLHTLTVTYRITRQTAVTATEQLTRAGGRAPDLKPIRDGAPTEVLTCSHAELISTILNRVGQDVGRVGVVVPDATASEWMSLLAAAAPAFGVGDDALDSPVAVLTARDTKGLEFDHVYVVDPARLSSQGTRGSDIYVACTRATQTLHLVTVTAPGPEVPVR